MKPDVYIVGFHCCGNTKHPLLRNLLRNKKQRESSTFCSLLPSILQYVHLVSPHAGGHGERLVYGMPFFVIIRTTFHINVDG